MLIFDQLYSLNFCFHWSSRWSFSLYIYFLKFLRFFCFFVIIFILDPFSSIMCPRFFLVHMQLLSFHWPDLWCNNPIQWMLFPEYQYYIVFCGELQQIKNRTRAPIFVIFLMLSFVNIIIKYCIVIILLFFSLFCFSNIFNLFILKRYVINIPSSI